MVEFGSPSHGPGRTRTCVERMSAGFAALLAVASRLTPAPLGYPALDRPSWEHVGNGEATSYKASAEYSRASVAQLGARRKRIGSPATTSARPGSRLNVLARGRISDYVLAAGARPGAAMMVREDARVTTPFATSAQSRDQARDVAAFAHGLRDQHHEQRAGGEPVDGGVEVFRDVVAAHPADAAGHRGDRRDDEPQDAECRRPSSPACATRWRSRSPREGSRRRSRPAGRRLRPRRPQGRAVPSRRRSQSRMSPECRRRALRALPEAPAKGSAIGAQTVAACPRAAAAPRIASWLAMLRVSPASPLVAASASKRRQREHGHSVPGRDSGRL